MPTNYESLSNQFKEIKVGLHDEAGKVAIVTLNRTAARNAWTNLTQDELIRAFGVLNEDDRVKVVVLTGSENKNQIFCAGADLSMGDFSGGGGVGGVVADENSHRDGGGQFVTWLINHGKKVTIAAINGHASGIGITQTLGMDLRVIWRDAKVSFPFVRIGIVPEAGSTFLLPKLLGYSRALQIFLLGRVLKADDQVLNGLFFPTMPEKREDVLPLALQLANEIASKTSSVSCYVTKHLVWHGAETVEGQHLLDSRAMFTLGDGKDSKEGVKSFMEKRTAKFDASVSKDLPSFVPWWKNVDTVVRSKL